MGAEGREVACRVRGCGFVVWNSGSRVEGLGLRVGGLEVSRSQALSLRSQALSLRSQALGFFVFLVFGVQGLGFRIQG
jgi:hypothetical protein